MNTRTCKSQQTSPISFGSPKIMSGTESASRAVLPGMPQSPQEVQSREVTHPSQPVRQCQWQGWKWDMQRYPGPLPYPADFLPAVNCAKFYLWDGFKRVKRKKERKKKKKSPKTNIKTPSSHEWKTIQASKALSKFLGAAYCLNNWRNTVSYLSYNLKSD